MIVKCCEFCSATMTDRIIPYYDYEICKACAAEKVKSAMMQDETAVLYLDQSSEAAIVTDFYNCVRFAILKSKIGHHNIAGRRTDVWFRFQDYIWHGINYGDNNTLLHCRRTKKKHIETNTRIVVNPNW